MRGYAGIVRDRQEQAIFECDEGGNPQAGPIGRGRDTGVLALAAWQPTRGAGGDRKGQISILVNDQFRLCFRWTDDDPTDVEMVDYH